MTAGGRSQRPAIDYCRLSVMIVISVVAYNEFLVYMNAYRSWPTIDQKQRLKILFVADPQIQGANDMDSYFLGIITRWDSDRYLSKTYSWAKYAYKSDVIVFLGDLMDEGSQGSDSEYQTYATRFKSIYDTKAVKIYVAGDNDVGGEGSDPVTAEKIRRFKKTFPSRANFLFQLNPNRVIQRYDLSDEDGKEKHPIIEIIPANALTFKSSDESWFGVSREIHPNVKFRIVVSHMPILPSPNPSFSKEVMNYLKPSVIFSAHDHRGLDYSVSKSFQGRPYGNVTLFTQKKSEEDLDEPNIIQIHAEDQRIHEVIVPTCSYRMGVKEMAFGLVTINFDQDEVSEITYFNLWLPSRFPLLYLYLATLSISATLFLIGRVKKRSRRTSVSASGRRRSSFGSRTNAHYSKLV